MASVLGCSRRTIEHGIGELRSLPDDPAENGIRRLGAGRKRSTEAHPELVENFFFVVEPRTAGDPMHEQRFWTDLCLAEIADALSERGTPVRAPTARCLLEEHNFAKRKIVKSLPGGTVPERNEQLEHIASLRETYEFAGNPVFGITMMSCRRGTTPP